MDFYQIRGKTLIFLPQASEDCIQQSIKNTLNYWDLTALRIINKYLKDESVILDIGANIGSHTLYWAKERKAKKIYSFEPFDMIYQILKTNVEINSLQNIVTTFNFGLSDEECKATKGHVFNRNLGSTKFLKKADGDVLLKTLDSLEIPEQIDLIKIDVEGAEVEVLKGALKIIEKNKPILVIESFTRKAELEDVIFPLGYVQVDTIRQGEDYVYMYKG